MKSAFFIIFLILSLTAMGQTKGIMTAPQAARLQGKSGSPTIFTAKKGDTVEVLFYKLAYYRVKVNGRYGYMKSVPSTIPQHSLDSIVMAQKAKTEEKSLKYAKGRKADLIDKYGEKVANRIMGGEVWVGMTDKMAHDSWGKPDKINKSGSEYGSREQWVYRTRDVYLYFTNGKLKSFQDYRDK